MLTILGDTRDVVTLDHHPTDLALLDFAYKARVINSPDSRMMRAEAVEDRHEYYGNDQP